MGSKANAKLLPYGEELTSPPTDNTGQKFATYFRDAGGLDYADQRYYTAVMGRFMTPDSITAGNATLLPDNWNKYAYVSSDPAHKTDPFGLCSPDDNPPCYSTTGFSTMPRPPADLIDFMQRSYGQFTGPGLGASYAPAYAEMLGRQISAQQEAQGAELIPVGKKPPTREECYTEVLTSFNNASIEIHTWIDQITSGSDVPKPSLTSVPSIVRTAIQGSRGLLYEGISGVTGGLLGGFSALVVSMGAAVITSPIIRPTLRNLGHSLANVELVRAQTELLQVVCDKNPLAGLAP